MLGDRKTISNDAKLFHIYEPQKLRQAKFTLYFLKTEKQPFTDAPQKRHS